jgi:tetratricopeptide (TPR) repeat protein
MISGTFSRSVALNVGEIAPAIVSPGEAFDVLVGPWIEDKAHGRFSVSPLLSNAALDVHGADQIKQLHSDLAAAILKIRPFDPRELQSVVLHAKLGQNTKALKTACGIITVNLRETPALANAFWTLPILDDHGGAIYPEDAETSCVLRLCQFLVAEQTEEPAKAAVIGDKLVQELKELRSPMRDELFFIAAFNYCTAPNIPVSAKSIMDMTTEVKRILVSRPDLDEAFNKAGDVPGVRVGADYRTHHFMFAAASLKLGSNEEFVTLIRMLDGLSPEERDDLLRGSEIEPTGGSLFVNRGWVSNLRSARDGIDPIATEKIYDEALALFLQWGATKLFKYAIVCKAVVIDEYALEPERALKFLDSVRADLKDDVYLQHEKAKILSRHGRHAEADAIWTVIGRQLADLDFVDRAYAFRHAAISASKVEKWDEAIAYYTQAEAAAALGSDALKPMHVGFIADRALAFARRGKFPDAVATLYSALKLLPDVPSDSNLRAYHVHATVRHAVAWLNTFISRTLDPRLGKPERELIAFVPGMCSNPEPHPDINKHQLQSPETAHLLLASTATELGCSPNIAADYFAQHGEMAAPLAYFDFAHALTYRALQDLDAVALGSALPRMAAAMIWYKRDGIASLVMTAIPTSEGEDFGQPQVIALLTDHAAAYLALALAKGRDVQSVSDELFKALDASLPAFPLALRAVLRFGPLSEHHLEPVLREWCRALHATPAVLDVPRDLSLFLFRATNYLAVSFCGHSVGLTLAALAAERWTYFLESMRFALASPNLYESEIRDACASEQLKGLPKVADILLRSAPAAKAPLAQSAHEFLSTVRDGTFKSSTTQPSSQT